VANAIGTDFVEIRDPGKTTRQTACLNSCRPNQENRSFGRPTVLSSYRNEVYSDPRPQLILYNVPGAF